MSVSSDRRARERFAAREGRVERPVFIGGLDRSGKTTMRAFLVSHPNVAIPPVGSNMETYFYGRFGDLVDPGNVERCLRAMLRYKHVRVLDPDAQRIREEFARGPATYERLFSLFLIQYAERQGKPRWGAQSGLIERYADQVFEAFPGACVVHMVRDPRDRYAASLEAWPNGRGRAGGATARWRYSMRLADRNLALYPGRYLVVRFEDLVLETERVVREVCEFIGESFDPAMLEMGGAPEHRRKLFGDGRATALSAEHIGGFRGRVPPDELAFIELHARALMRRYGYARERVTLSPAGRARFVAVRWPGQLARMVAWRSLEAMQQRFPSIAGRTPDARMLVDADDGGV